MKNITPKELEQFLLEKKPVTIIDVREENETASGMIPGAVNIPLSKMPQKINDLDKSKEYVLVCHSGGRSQYAALILEQQGFNVSNMLGGMMSWIEPIEIK